MINDFNELNTSKKLQNENINLFTLDAEKLYPSIQPQLALIAIKEAFAADKTTETKTKMACEELIKFSFDNSYVSYKDETFSSKIGIPTGGSLSRQIADIFLHWVLFVKANPNIPTIEAIRFFKRFIDDIIGVWRGTRRAFDSFVALLNKEAAKFGIHFPVKEIQFGKSVNILELTAYLDEDNTIHYKSYTKPTDSKRYLNTRSFHPRPVFRSIPFSQMIRAIHNNSKEETRTSQMTELIRHFKNSGYSEQELKELKEKAINKTSASNQSTPGNDNTLIFPMYYFDGVQEFKTLIHSMQGDIKQLIGETKVMFAMKKGTSLGNSLVQNKALCLKTLTNSSNQKCGAPGCRQCPLVNTERRFTINDTNISIPTSLNCKSRSVVYLWKCKLCLADEYYFGRTTQKCHSRTNGHRGCFSDKDDKWEKSALSMHSKDVHGRNFDLKNFTISIIKKISPQNIRREEFRYIEKYRTIQLGLNRYKAS